DCSINPESSLQYIEDDIRSCTMQRRRKEDTLGLIFKYHKHEKFHYLLLSSGYQETLAYRAGIKPYDRVIEFNEVNIERESSGEYEKRYDQILLKPITLLVCNPSTYAYYRQQRRSINTDLPTVKFMQLANAADRMDNETPSRSASLYPSPKLQQETVVRDHCVIRWNNTNELAVFPISAINRNSSSEIILYETYEINLGYATRKGKIISLGTDKECELFRSNMEPYAVHSEHVDRDRRDSSGDSRSTMVSAVINNTRSSRSDENQDDSPKKE
ncbi:unnamed protein product, partial [Didymodactylos carnosus]